MSVWFKSHLNPWYIWIPSNPNLYSTKIIMKMRWQTIASNVSIRTISPTATPLPKAYDCVAVYIAGRRTSLVVYGWWPQPPTKKTCQWAACFAGVSFIMCLWVFIQCYSSKYLAVVYVGWKPEFPNKWSVYDCGESEHRDLMKPIWSKHDRITVPSIRCMTVHCFGHALCWPPPTALFPGTLSVITDY